MKSTQDRVVPVKTICCTAWLPWSWIDEAACKRGSRKLEVDQIMETFDAWRHPVPAMEKGTRQSCLTPHRDAFGPV